MLMSLRRAIGSSMRIVRGTRLRAAPRVASQFKRPSPLAWAYIHLGRQRYMEMDLAGELLCASHSPTLITSLLDVGGWRLSGRWGWTIEEAPQPRDDALPAYVHRTVAAPLTWRKGARKVANSTLIKARWLAKNRSVFKMERLDIKQKKLIYIYI